MSELSVNEHLEGILSDFEALKRSFEIEDVDDIPSSSTSPISTPVSPSSSTFFLQHNKAFEGHGGDGQASSLAFNNNNNSVSSVGHRSCINLGSSPSPVLRSRSVVSSLSFNRGTMNKPSVHQNGSSVTRALSFQSRVNPSSYYLLSGPNSDNDSLHSSTSSLEYSGNTGGAPPMNKFGSYPSPPPQREYQSPLQLSPQQLGGDANLIINHSLKKFSSHGSVFHNEMNQRSGVMTDTERPRGPNHGSMPSLDLQNRDGRGIVGMQRGEGRGSPGVKYANANAYWNGGVNNHNSFVMEQGHQQPGLKVLRSPQSKVKEPLRLNKFPLDLESLVSNTGAEPPATGHGGSVKPPVPYPRSSGLSQHKNSPPSSLITPSASLSSLDSPSDTQTSILHNPPLPSSPSSLSCSPVPMLDSSPNHLPLSRSPQMVIPVGPQIAKGVPNVPRLISTPSPSSAPVVERGAGDAGDSVGSILERIASFSRPALTDCTDAPVTQSSNVQNHCRSTPVGGSALSSRSQQKMNHKEPRGELESELLAPMEETEEKDRGIMGVERGDEVQCDGQLSSKNVQNCLAGTEENGVDLSLSTKEKGMEEEEELRKELEVEMELEADAYQRFPAQQISLIRGNDLFGYVGIEAVLDQMKRKTMKSAFEFNIMVVGQSGLGKSTLVNTLFKSKVSRKSCLPNHTEEISKTVKLHSISHVIEEKGVKMKLTVVDTPGFGDQINNDNCWEPIVTYVQEQYEKYLREELHVNRKRRIPDTRVHCCIYFLPATGHRLRPIDVEFMRRLGKIVSIVPVIAKADTLTIEERQEFKERIRQDLAANGIQVYPQKEYDEDPEDNVINERIRENIPFAVVGTDKEHHVNGNTVLGRKTKWGIIEVENVAHCEFSNLRDLLIRTHLQDLKDVTHNIHYETYRVRRLNESNITFSELGLLTRPLENGTADKCDSNSLL